MKKRRFNKWDIAGVSLVLILFAVLASFRAYLAGYPYKVKCPTHGVTMKRCYLFRGQRTERTAVFWFGPKTPLCEMQEADLDANWYFWCPQSSIYGDFCS